MTIYKNIRYAIALSVLAALVAVSGAAPAFAMEITGTLGTQSSGSQTGSSQTNGANGSGGTVVGGSSESGSPSGTSGSSATTQTAHYGQSHPTYAYAPSSGVQSDGSLAQASDYTGTGGGYDPSLDSYLASLREGGNGNALSPQDAVAYNQAAGVLNPASAANLAAVGASGTSGSKALVAILVGLVAAGLAGYAVNAYLAYRRERGL